MAKRRRRRGRRGLRGLGVLKMGMGRDLIPPAIGVGLTALTTIGIRSFVTPVAGTPSEALYRAAPFIGAGAGVLGGVAMGVVGSKGQAASAVMTSIATGVVLWGMERLNARKPGAVAALVGSSAPAPLTGLRAIVPEYPDKRFATRGLGAIVMENLRGNQQNQGADISLRGVVNPVAFGSRTFG